jgi:hypothetical protein
MFVDGSTGYQDVCEWGNWIRMGTTCTSSPEQMCVSCPCCRFVVLVTGTMVYGRGDEEGSREELAEALEGETEAAAAAQETSPLLPPAAAAAPAATSAVPMPGRPGAGPSEPVIIRSSFKATMNMMSGSYSRWALC